MGITFIEANSNDPNETMTVNELIDWLEYYKKPTTQVKHLCTLDTAETKQSE